MASSEPNVRSVRRAVDILMALSDGPLNLTALATRTGLSMGTGHRLLTSLNHRQLVIQDPTSGVYMLGPGCYRFVEAFRHGRSGLGLLARPVLEALRLECGETVTLHVRIGDQRICIEELPSPQPIRFTAGIGAADPIHVGAAGKVLLAAMKDDDLEQLIRSIPLDKLTSNTRTDASSLRKELQSIRRRGWAESRGERVVGAAAVSTPIVDQDDRCLAALSILAPEARMPASHVPAFGQRVLAAGRELNAALTSPGPASALGG